MASAGSGRGTHALAVPNLRHLRVLETVAKLESVSRAAEQLHVSQPAVTQAIAKLEAEHGIDIFERTSTGSFSTALGKLLLTRVERFFAITEEAIDEAYNPASERSPRRGIEKIITATHIRSLLAIAASGGVAESAREIGVSDTALCRSARELERALRRPLCRRAPTGLVPTPLGAELARKFRLALRELDYARDEIALAQGAGVSTIVVGVLPMTGSLALAAAIDAFMADQPSARVKIVDGSYVALLESLRNGGIDMIFGLLRRPEWATDLAEEPLFRDSFCIVARPGHPLTQARSVARAQLARYEWIVPAEGTPRRTEIDRLLGDMRPPPRLAVETSSLSTMRALLACSDRLTVMTRSEVDLEERAGLCVALDYPLPGPLPAKGLTTRVDWLPTELHRGFVARLRETTAEGTAQGAGPARLSKAGGFGASAQARRRPKLQVV